VSLSWQVRNAVTDAPRVSIAGRCGLARTPREDHSGFDLSWSLPVELVNTGKRPVTVIDVFWVTEMPHGPVRVQGPHDGPLLPHRLEAHDRAFWEMRIPCQGFNIAGAFARPSADVVMTSAQLRRLLKSDESGLLAGEWQQLLDPADWPTS
jgi:hypothetical protein